MATIKVRVQGEIATNLTPEVKLVCQNDKYDVEFEFDDSWAKSNFKTALFIYNGQLIAIPFDGTICKMPALYETELLHIGVKSNDVVGLHTTTPAKVVYLLSANDLTSNKIPEPSKDVYDEIIALLNKYISGGGGSGGTDEERVREIVAEETADLQTKTDESFQTEDKTVVGAINELNNECVKFTNIASSTQSGVVFRANKAEILNRGFNNYIPASNLDIAVKVGITTNTEPLTSDEQLNAQKWLGVDDRFAVINLALEQSGLLKKYKQPIEQEYNERVTADGANVLDGSKAVLKKVVGSTVACKQLFDISKINATSNVSKTDRDIIVTNNYGTGVNKILKELFPAVKAGITYTVACTVEANAPFYASNGMITAIGGTNILAPHYFESAGSAYVKQTVVFTEEDLTREVLFYGLADSSTGVTNSTVKWKDLMLVEGDYTNTEMPPYQPYFTGLKSASFGGIESTNEDGTETSTLTFLKTEMPLGKTIDFENKKITDYGVDLVLTGTENWGYYKYSTQNYNGVISINICQAGNKQVADYVATDSTRGADNDVYRSGKMWCGYAGSTTFMWIGILDILGYTTQGVESTAEEQATAIANFKAYLAQRYADGNPVTIRYLSSVLQSETDFTDGNEYTAKKGGREKVIDNDGKEYGADNTLTQDYILVTEVE